MQEARIIADEALGIDHAGQVVDIALLNAFDVKGTDACPFFYICNCQSLLDTSAAQDVSDHEVPS